MWLNIFLITFPILLVVVVVYGGYHWETGTREIRSRLEEARLPMKPLLVDFQKLNGLPPLVQSYFRKVLKEGQSMVVRANIHHSGSFNMGENADRWKPFTSDQMVITQRPGFDWDARITLMPGLKAQVHDAYIAGEGILHATLFGIFSVANLRGAGDIAEGELMRYFAEAAWYPTALLPSQGVRWEPVDEHSARGILTDGPVEVALLFTFNEQGLIDTVRTDARGRIVSGKVVPTPWQGRFWNYEERSGMQVPINGEVEWQLPEGVKPYWRGQIIKSFYEFAR